MNCPLLARFCLEWGASCCILRIENNETADKVKAAYMRAIEKILNKALWTRFLEGWPKAAMTVLLLFLTQHLHLSHPSCTEVACN